MPGPTVVGASPDRSIVANELEALLRQVSILENRITNEQESRQWEAMRRIEEQCKETNFNLSRRVGCLQQDMQQLDQFLRAQFEQFATVLSSIGGDLHNVPHQVVREAQEKTPQKLLPSTPILANVFGGGAQDIEKIGNSTLQDFRKEFHMFRESFTVELKEQEESIVQRLSGRVQKLAQIPHSLADLPAEQPPETVDVSDAAFEKALEAAKTRPAMQEEDTALIKPAHSVEDLYKTEGWPQKLARSETFVEVTMVIVSLNVIWMGFSIDLDLETNIYRADLVFLVAEMGFSAFFIFELIVRFLAFRHNKDCLKDGWFIFDSILIAALVLDNFIIAPLEIIFSSSLPIRTKDLRLFRLLKLTKVGRVARNFPELVLIGEGTVGAMRAVSGTVIVLVILAYTFGLVMRLLMTDQKDMNAKLQHNTHMNFETLPDSFWALGQIMFMLDNSGVILCLLMQGDQLILNVACLVLVIFILLSDVTVLNLLVGQILDQVGGLKTKQDEKSDTEIIRNTMTVALLSHDDGDAMFSRPELLEILRDPVLARLLRRLNIDIGFVFRMLTHEFATPDAKIGICDFIDTLVLCRGDENTKAQVVLHAFSMIMKDLQALKSDRG